MLGDEPGVFEADAVFRADRLRGLEELGGGVQAARAHLVGDLARAALLLEELAARLAHAPLGVRGARGVGEHGVNDRGRADEPLLVDGDEFEHPAFRGRARERGDRRVGRLRVERDRLLHPAREARARREVGEHRRRGLGRRGDRRERGRLLRGERLVGGARYALVRVRAQRHEHLDQLVLRERQQSPRGGHARLRRRAPRNDRPHDRVR